MSVSRDPTIGFPAFSCSYFIPVLQTDRKGKLYRSSPLYIRLLCLGLCMALIWNGVVSNLILSFNSYTVYNRQAAGRTKGCEYNVIRFFRRWQMLSNHCWPVALWQLFIRMWMNEWKKVLNGCVCRLHVSVNSGGRLDIVDALLASNRCNADTTDVNGQHCSRQN